MGESPGGLNKMKKMYMKKEEGVSPVIATILMVAITVVLAATVWLLVSGYMGGGQQTPLAASLTYKASESTSTKAVFGVTMNTPTQTDYSNVKITLKNSTGTYTIQLTGNSGSSGDFSVQILDLNGNNKLDTGDELVISNAKGVSGVTVYLYINGYSGNAQGTVPA